MMAELKTKPTTVSVDALIQGVAGEDRRRDCVALVAMMKRVTGTEPTVWSSGIVGFGSYHYKYASGREGDWFEIGFAPRKANLAVYVVPGLDRFGDALARLGKYKTGKGCLYIKQLADVDSGALEGLLASAVTLLRQASG
jgi:Domain of unknown function (DU1801)